MKHTIFRKIFTVNALLIIMTFVIIGVLMFTFLTNYAAVQRQDMLTAYSARINQASEYLSSDYTPQAHKIYSYMINTLANNSNSVILIVDLQGNVFASSSAEISVAKLSRDLYYDAVMGKKIIKTGNFGGLFDRPMLTVGFPLVTYGKINGAVIFNTPLPDLYKIRWDIIKMFIIFALIALVAAFLLNYLLAKRISKPLKQINSLAKIIANGDFYKRVDIRTKDEIGELGNTFNKMAESLSQLEDMRRGFIADVSHELRTPMTTISGFLEGIMDGTIPRKKQKEYLKTVSEEVLRLSRLVNDLLDITRLETCHSLEMKKFEINELIRLKIIQFETAINEKNISVNVDFVEEAVYVLGDEDSIQRVITNLLDNAVKFTNQDGYINIKEVYDTDKVKISIENSGEGIEPQCLEFIFNRFYKTDKSRSYDKNGVGLGLFIVKNIIELHGETILAESTAGEFTKFIFSLKKA